MKYLLIILIPLIYGCQTTTAQKVDPSIQEDREFEELLSKVETNNKLSLQVQAPSFPPVHSSVHQVIVHYIHPEPAVSGILWSLNSLFERKCE